MPIVWKASVGEHGLNALEEEQQPYYVRWGAENVLVGATEESAREILALIYRAQQEQYVSSK